jgi:hypothetical protein
MQIPLVAAKYAQRPTVRRRGSNGVLYVRRLVRSRRPPTVAGLLSERNMPMHEPKNAIEMARLRAMFGDPFSLGLMAEVQRLRQKFPKLHPDR